LVSTNSTDTPFRRLALDQFVVQPLMIPLAMVVGDKFRDSPSMMALVEQRRVNVAELMPRHSTEPGPLGRRLQDVPEQLGFA
jgi:hypothetical protein